MVALDLFSPQFMNIALSYAKKFTYNMSAGLTMKMISQSAAELSANGVALDAGVHYETGRRGEAKFGITLKILVQEWNLTVMEMILL